MPFPETAFQAVPRHVQRGDDRFERFQAEEPAPGGASTVVGGTPEERRHFFETLGLPPNLDSAQPLEAYIDSEKSLQVRVFATNSPGVYVYQKRTDSRFGFKDQPWMTAVYKLGRNAETDYLAGLKRPEET